MNKYSINAKFSLVFVNNINKGIISPILNASKKTPIKSVSIKQAREPIYKSSINSNKKYSKYLDFFKELDKLNN